jgi:hypothetical protein
MWMNEEGKLIGLPTNVLATRLCRTAKYTIAQTDYIVGSVVFTGVDHLGDVVDCPQDFIDVCKQEFRNNF